MRARRKGKKSGSHERWLVSYADFITLLFAFFVVMFASSHTDRAKASRVSESVRAAFDGSGSHVSTSPSPQTDQHSVGSTSLAPILKSLVHELDPEIRAGTMQVRMEERGIVVSLSQATFFPSGEDALDPATWESIGKVARTVCNIPNLLRTEGHTDSIPIHTARFRSNWDLSAARAIALMELLRDRWQISPGRMAITGYADSAPLAPNLTEAGRARNRRVDIVILNLLAGPKRAN